MISAKRKAVEGGQAGQAAREGPAVAFTCLARGLSCAARDVSGDGAGWACESASASAAGSVSEAGRRYSISSYMCGKRMASMSSVLRNRRACQRKGSTQARGAGRSSGRSRSSALENEIALLRLLLLRRRLHHVLLCVRGERGDVERAGGVILGVERQALTCCEVQDVLLYGICARREERRRENGAGARSVRMPCRNSEKARTLSIVAIDFAGPIAVSRCERDKVRIRLEHTFSRPRLTHTIDTCDSCRTLNHSNLNSGQIRERTLNLEPKWKGLV